MGLAECNNLAQVSSEAVHMSQSFLVPCRAMQHVIVKAHSRQDFHMMDNAYSGQVRLHLCAYSKELPDQADAIQSH